MNLTLIITGFYVFYWILACAIVGASSTDEDLEKYNRVILIVTTLIVLGLYLITIGVFL